MYWRACRKYMGKLFKVHKEHNKTNTRHESKGERPYHAKPGPKDEENKPITKAIHLNFTKHHHGLSLEDNWRQPNKDGLDRSHPGCAPKLARSAPSLVGWLIPPLTWQFRRCMPGSMYLKGGLRSALAFHMGMAHLQGPPSPPIKGGHLPPLKETTKEQHHYSKDVVV